MKLVKILLLFLFCNLDAVYIKVLLMELEAGTVSISHPQKLLIQRLNKNRVVHAPELIVNFVNGQLYLNDKPYFHLEPIIISTGESNEPLKLAGIAYHGYLRLILDGKNLYIINYLDLEDYVSSVVKTEGWPGWPLRFYEIQAIISRTYALNKIFNNRKANKLHDICNTNLHQTYTGWHDLAHIKQVVESTKGLFLAYDNKPIDAMYDCCCGGVTPSNIDGIPHKKLPYLSRNTPCLYCKPTKIYSWKLSFDLADLKKVLRVKFPHLKNITNILVSEKDKAGIVKKIKVWDHKRIYNISGKEFYSLIKEVKSFIFDIKLVDNKIIIEGKGYGHHRGLCQWGAHEMVKLDKSCKEILDFYYPKAILKRIQS